MFLDTSSPTALTEQAKRSWNTSLLATVFEYFLPKSLNHIKEIYESSSSSSSASSSHSIDFVLFYRLWPFISRLPENVAKIAHQMSFLTQLLSQPLFLSDRTFKSIFASYMITYGLSTSLQTYLKGYLSILDVPVYSASEIATYLGLKNDPQFSKLNRITPSKIREILKNNR
jgi:hypothetical protein